MRKRKPREFAPERLLYRILAAGVIGLIAICIWAIWNWERQRPAPTPTAVVFYPTRVVYPSFVPYPTPTPPPLPTPVPRSIPIAGSLLFSNLDGRIGVVDDSVVTYLDPGMRANIVNACPDKTRRLIAYLYSGQLHLYSRELGDVIVEAKGQATSITWSSDCAALAFVARADNTDYLYRLSLKALDPILLLTAPQFAAPPIWHPSTPRLLIAEPAGRKTTLYTIDANCGSYGECANSRQDFTTLPFAVNWLDYHPSGLYIATAERETGLLYLISTAKKDFTSLLNYGQYKLQPRFSPDGSKLAYLDGAGRVYAAQLDDMAAMRVLPANDSNFTVSSFSWR